MKVVRLDPATVNGNSLLQLCPGGNLKRWTPLGKWHGASGHQRDAQFPRRIEHLFAPVPAVGEMFVIEQWDEAI